MGHGVASDVVLLHQAKLHEGEEVDKLNFRPHQVCLQHKVLDYAEKVLYK